MMRPFHNYRKNRKGKNMCLKEAPTIGREIIRTHCVFSILGVQIGYRDVVRTAWFLPSIAADGIPDIFSVQICVRTYPQIFRGPAAICMQH